MSKPNTEVALTQEQEIALIEDAMAARAEALRKKLKVTGNRISFKDKKFTLPDGQNFQKLDVVVIDWNSRNMFYEGNYDPNNTSLPTCYAIGDIPEELAPPADLETKKAELCKNCEYDQWGSGGGNSKACKNTRSVVVKITGRNELYVMSLAPTSIKLFDDAMNSLISAFGDPLKATITISFNTNLTYGQVVWSNPQPNPDWVEHYKIQQSGETKKILNQKPE